MYYRFEILHHQETSYEQLLAVLTPSLSHVFGMLFQPLWDGFLSAELI